MGDDPHGRLYIIRRACRDERWHGKESKPRTRPSDNHLRRPKIGMDMRDSFSRLKNKLKRPLTGGGHKPERAGTDVAGERVDREGYLLRSELHPEVEGTEKNQNPELDHPITPSADTKSTWAYGIRSLG